MQALGSGQFHNTGLAMKLLRRVCFDCEGLSRDASDCDFSYDFSYLMKLDSDHMFPHDGTFFDTSLSLP